MALLNDEQMWQYVVNGFVMVNTDLPADFHETIYRQTEGVFENEGNPGNNILPRVPEIQTIFDQPEVCGAFSSILGPDYTMHIHRHPHINKPHSKHGGWHKDSYWGYKKVRYHRNRWAMAFYYPQDVPLELGPTELVPGSHLIQGEGQYEVASFQRLLDDRGDMPNSHHQAASTGSITITCYPIWHRRTASTGEGIRNNLKYRYSRTVRPRGDWIAEPSFEIPGRGHPMDAGSGRKVADVADMFAWLSGREPSWN